MKKALMRIVILCLALSLLVLPVQAATTEKTTEEYAAYFQQIMELIDSEYLYEVSNQSLYEAAIKAMFDSLDIYSTYYAADDSDEFTNTLNSTYVGIGVVLVEEGDYIKIERVFMNGPADKGGVLPGDLIIDIEGESAQGFSTLDVQNRVLGEKGTSVTITFNRNGAEYSKTFIRDTIVLKSVERYDLSQVIESASMEAEAIASYIKLETFASQTVSGELQAILNDEKAKGTQYIILDLRNNGGGYVDSGLNVLRQLVPSGPILKFINNTGRELVYESSLAEPPFEIIALINNNSASATEFVAAALKESGHATLIGETTYGKGVAQNVISLQDGSIIKITTEEFFSGQDAKINAVGVSPDVTLALPKYLNANRRLYISDTGEDVYLAEKILNYLGYDVKYPDEIYDRGTFDATKAFQKDAGLYSYGVCDYTTQKYLNQALLAKINEKDLQLEKAYEILLEKIK